MRKGAPAADPDAYVRALNGWRRACVETLRAAVRKATLEETVKWGISSICGERSGAADPRRG